MKKAIILSLLFLLFSTKAFCQVQKEAPVSELLKITPQEKIFLHFNSSLLFAGEYLYYKLYALNSETENFTDLSKIAYVELIGEDGNQVFHHKLQLENGLAQGDFFIPTSVPSGNYKILGYTQWMKNGGNKYFFQNDLIIINPYRGDQSALRDPESKESDSIFKITSSEKVDENALFGYEENENFRVQLLNGELFRTRESVNLSIEPLNDAFEAGNYSISVKKVDSIEVARRWSAENYNRLYPEGLSSKNAENDQVFLPELRGDLISGSIRAIDTAGNAVIDNREIALSIPGEDFIFKTAATDQNGDFYYNIDENYSGEKAFLQVLGENNTGLEISLHQDPKIDTSSLIFEKFYITPEMESLILRRSVYNQIENAYFSVKPDTLVSPKVNTPFFGQKPTFFDLDEYTRFPTIRETFIEIVTYAGIRNAGNGKKVIEVRGPEGSTEHQLPPLLIVDGMVVQDHEHFIAFPAGRVQRIGIIRENYYYGPQVYSGIIIVETINGNYWESLQDDFIQEFTLMKPQPKKEYFQQKYNDSTASKTSRIPDFRNQLLWLPSVKLTSEEKIIEFFTSDVPGKFEISIEGFSKDGEAFSIRKIFTVEE